MPTPVPAPPRRAGARRLVTALGTLGLSLVLAACGGGGTDRTRAHVRLVNASGYTALDMRVDGQLIQSGVAYGATDATVDVDPDRSATTLARTGSATTLLSFTPAVSKNRHYTLLAFGAEGALRQMLIEEEVGAPASGHTWLRVVNGAPDAGSLDVYVTSSGEALQSAVPALSAAAFGQASALVDVTSGTWRLRVTGQGKKDEDLRLDVPAVALADRGVTTLVLTGGAGGVLVNGLLIAQQGAIAKHPGAQSRVRVLAGATGSDVSATLSGVVLASGIPTPSVTNYQLVDSAATALSISAAGNSVAAPATALAGGGDYTLLVYGTTPPLAAAWITDDNRLPASSEQVRIRLVNATPNWVSTLIVDGTPVAQGVSPGSGSAYAEVSAGTAVPISVTAAGLITPLFSVPAQELVRGGTYTVFVVGAPGASSGIVRADRR